VIRLYSYLLFFAVNLILATRAFMMDSSAALWLHSVAVALFAFLAVSQIQEQRKKTADLARFSANMVEAAVRNGAATVVVEE
jgi:hypothetical protein